MYRDTHNHTRESTTAVLVLGTHAGSFHPEMQRLKEQFAAKVGWYLKRIGQDTGYWDKVLRKEVEPYSLMHANDPNKNLSRYTWVKTAEGYKR